MTSLQKRKEYLTKLRKLTFSFVETVKNVYIQSGLIVDHHTIPFPMCEPCFMVTTFNMHSNISHGTR